MIIEKIWESLVIMLSNTLLKIITALLIFFFGFVFGRLLGRVIYKMLKEAELNKFLKESTGIKINADNILSNIVTYTIYFLSVLAALEQLGLANIILYLLATAMIIILLLSFFLAVRDFLPNLISGFYLYGKMREGITVEIDNIKGKLVQVELLHLKIQTKKGDVIFIPNSLVTKAKIKIKS